MPFKNTGKLKPALSAAGAAVHHGFHLVGVQTVGGVQRLDGFVELLERYKRGDADFGRGDH